MLALIFLLLSGLTLSACDTGEDIVVDNDVTDEPALAVLADNAPEIQANQSLLQTFSSVIPSGYVVSESGTYSLTASAPGSGSATISQLLDASGNATGALIVRSTSGYNFFVPAGGLTGATPTTSAVDARGNTISFRFDSDGVFQAVSFTPGLSAGQFSSALGEQLNTFWSSDPEAFLKYNLSPNFVLSGGDVWNAFRATTAGAKILKRKRVSGEEAPIVLTGGESDGRTFEAWLNALLNGKGFGGTQPLIGGAVIIVGMSPAVRTNCPSC